MSYLVKKEGAKASSFNADTSLPADNQASNVELVDMSRTQEEMHYIPLPPHLPFQDGAGREECLPDPLAAFLVQQDHNYAAPAEPTLPTEPSPPIRVNGQLLLEDAASVPQPAKEETVDDSITRCICQFQHDDGYMICCDKCSVWQHIDCMGVDRTKIPDNYYCEQCSPRLVDATKARLIQAKKMEDLIDTSATDTDPEEQANHLASLNKKAVATSASKGKVAKQRKVLTKTKDKAPVRQKRKEKVKKEKENIKEMMRKQKGNINGQVKEVGNKPRPKLPKAKSRRKVASPVRPKSADRTMDFYNCNDRPWTDDYDKMDANSQSDEMDLVLMSMTMLGLPEENPKLTCIPNIPPVRKALVKKDRLGLEATRKIPKDSVIIEYIAHITSSTQFDRDHPDHNNMYLPFILIYSGLMMMKLCYDSTRGGNVARYVRRSCNPNASLEHQVERGNVRLYLCSTRDIPEGEEVTIPFDFDYNDCSYCVECACQQNACPVAKIHKKKIKRTRSSEAKPQRAVKRQRVAALERKQPLRRNSAQSQSKRSSAEPPAVEPEAVIQVKEEKPEPCREVVPVVEAEPPTRSRASRRASASAVATETLVPVKVEKVLVKEEVKEEAAPAPEEEEEEKESEFSKQEPGTEDSSETDNPSRKNSREDRKMAAIIKQIDEMEKRAKRRNAAQARKDSKQTPEEASEGSEGKQAEPATRTKSESPHKSRKRKISRRRSGVHSVNSERTSSRKRSRAASASVVSVTVSVSENTLSQDESSSASTSASTSIPSAPSTPVPASTSPQACPQQSADFSRIPKKKQVILERQQDVRPTTKKMEPLEVQVPEMFVTYMNTPGNAMERLQRRNSVSTISSKAADSNLGFTKKRWLRQAMSTEGGDTSSVGVAFSPSHVASLHSPSSSPPPVSDFVTPLKKRRLARESLSQDQPSTSCPSTHTPSQVGQGGPDYMDLSLQNGLYELARIALIEKEKLSKDVASPSKSAARVLRLEEETVDRVETAPSRTPTRDAGTVETSSTSAVVEGLGEACSEGNSQDNSENVEDSRTAEACVSSGQSVHPSVVESADAVSESRPKSPAEQSRNSTDTNRVSSHAEVQPQDRVGCSSSVVESSLSAGSDIPVMAVSEHASQVKDGSSTAEWKNLDNLESSSSSASCRGRGEEAETLRTDVLMESSESYECCGEERSSGQISSSQGFVPMSAWEDPHTSSQGNTTTTSRPVEVDGSESEVSLGPNISSSGDVVETGVGSSNSGSHEVADSAEETTGSCREAREVEEEGLSSRCSQQEVPREASSSGGEAGGSAPQECRVSSCSQDSSVEGEAGISSSHGQRSPGQEVEDGECDSSVPGMGEGVEVDEHRRERLPCWGEECGVDSTTQPGDRSTVDPVLSPEFLVGSSRTTGRDSAWAPGEAQSALLSHSSRGEARLGSEPEASSSSQADSASSQRTTKKKVSLLEYRLRQRERSNTEPSSEVSASQPVAPALFPPTRQSPPLEEVPPTLAPLPLFTPVQPAAKAFTPSKGGAKGTGKPREKQLSLSERLRLEFGLDDSEEEEMSHTADEDGDSGPNQQLMTPPPPPSTPYPSHLATRLPPPAPPLPPALPIPPVPPAPPVPSNSHMPSLIPPLRGNLPLRPPSPSPSSPLLPTPASHLHSSSSASSPLLPFPSNSSVPLHMKSGNGLTLGKGLSTPPSPFVRHPSQRGMRSLPTRLRMPVPPPPPGLPVAPAGIPLAAPVGQSDSVGMQRPSLGNGFIPNKRP